MTDLIDGDKEARFYPSVKSHYKIMTMRSASFQIRNFANLKEHRQDLRLTSIENL